MLVGSGNKQTTKLCETTFIAGNISKYIDVWKKLTNDQSVLQMVKGCYLEIDHAFAQVSEPRELPFSKEESNFVDNEIKKLLGKGVIEESWEQKDQFVSNIFLRPKKDGSFRMILNMKDLNESLEYHHFKMDSIQTCVYLMSPGSYMASLDLQDAYYSVPISGKHRKYLKFRWKGVLYHYTCLPNGLSSAPRFFTKLLKPVLSHLRAQGFTSSIYLDDLFLQGDTFQECTNNVQKTVALLTDLGFCVHQEKSNFIPKQVLDHLGFRLDSVNMTISLNPERQQKLVAQCNKMINASIFTIRELAQIIGIFISCVPGVEYGLMHYRALELQKISALKINKGNFEAKLQGLTRESKNDLLWWLQHAEGHKLISHGPFNSIIRTDASLIGWGAAVDGNTTGGRWTQEETKSHINVLELKAALLGLQSFKSYFCNKHVQLQMDNSTAVTYIRNMGGTHSELCNEIATKIWQWCIQHNIWLSSTHLPGVENVVADKESRNTNSNTEWTLGNYFFDKITNIFGKPEIDLFASRNNNKLLKYFSWRPDPGAIGIDAFSQKWNHTLLYAFPPFSVINRVLQKIEQEAANVILIAPMWPTQPWFPHLLHLLTREPVLLPTSPHLLSQPHNTQEIHPLWKKLRLMACLLSGKPCKKKVFLAKHRRLSLLHGGKVPKNNTDAIYKSGSFLHTLGASIPYTQI